MKPDTAVVLAKSRNSSHVRVSLLYEATRVDTDKSILLCHYNQFWPVVGALMHTHQMTAYCSGHKTAIFTRRQQCT